MPPKKGQNILGKSIIRSRFRGGSRPRDDDTTLHTTDTDSTPKWMKMQSITQENDLDAFLRNAELAGTEFTAEKLNVQLIVNGNNTSALHNPYLLSGEKEQQMLDMMDRNKDKLTVPRRPQWNTSTTAEELHSLEKESFLEWRRRLAVLEEDMQMVVTPFERNIEVWRQLWRVLERSDVVVQIVDARNPLFFYSEDLDKYIREIDVNKHRLLLINKADFLTESQRKSWADYFGSRGVRCAFFSATKAITALEQEDGMIEEETTLIARRLVGQSIDGEKPTADLRVLSCPELYELFESFRRHSSTSDDENDGGITIGLVGYPNVGKSSTINALVGQKKVTVSATPGKTKHFQTIVLSDSVTLCDCPGLVFPMFATTKAEMVCNGVLPIDQLREYSGPSTLVCQRIPRFYLEWRYGISLPRPDESEQEGRPPTSAELLCTYAAMRGFRKAGQGNPDESRAARIILKDYVKGELLFCHAPPGADQRLFNEENYREGGLKFVESQLAKDVLANRKTNESAGQHLPQTRKANTDGAASNSRHLDKEFFADKQAGKVHTLGKNASNDFSRADLLPKQNDDVKMGSARSPSGSGSSIDMQRLRDKKHKSTKRGKDRSWRVD